MITLKIELRRGLRGTVTRLANRLIDVQRDPTVVQRWRVRWGGPKGDLFDDIVEELWGDLYLRETRRKDGKLRKKPCLNALKSDSVYALLVKEYEDSLCWLCGTYGAKHSGPDYDCPRCGKYNVDQEMQAHGHDCGCEDCVMDDVNDCEV